MTIHDYKQYYKDDYNHSARLKEVFGVFNYKGCDYANPNDVKIEFKESHIYNKPFNKIRFAVYYKDYLDSDFIVFVYKEYSYVHKSKQILNKYKFDNEKAIAQPYLTTVSRNYLRKFSDLADLKIYLDKLNGSDV